MTDAILRDAILQRLGRFPARVPLAATFGPAREQDALFPIDGVPERFRAIIFPAGHSLPDPVKAAAYAFLDRWLGE